MKFPSPGAERVARALHDGGPNTAASLADRIGLSGAVVRRHLDALLAEGLVSASERPPYGPTPQRRRGRPARTFALTDAGSHAFDVAYDDLAIGALSFLAESSAEGTDPVGEFATRRARSWVERHQDRLTSQESTAWRVTELVSVLNEEGYAAAAVDGDGSAAVQICQHHCPVAHVAEQFPQLCEAETQAFEQLLGTHVLRLATIAHGDGVCTTLVPAAIDTLAGRSTKQDSPSPSHENREVHT